MLFYFGSNLMPGQGQAEYLTQEAQITWGKWFEIQTAGGVVDKDTVDSGNTVTTILRPGLALGIIIATGQLTHWDPYGTDGSNRLVGFYVGPSQAMSLIGATTTERFMGDILVSGNVRADAIVIPGEAAAGLRGKTYEFLLREQMLSRFHTDDDPSMSIMQLKHAVTAGDATLTIRDNNTLFVMWDTASATVLTLPAPVPGLKFGFLNLSTTAGTTLTLEGPATGEYWVAGAAANSVAIAGDTSVVRWVRAVKDATTPTYRYVVET